MPTISWIHLKKNLLYLIRTKKFIDKLMKSWVTQIRSFCFEPFYLIVIK